MYKLTKNWAVRGLIETGRMVLDPITERNKYPEEVVQELVSIGILPTGSMMEASDVTDEAVLKSAVDCGLLVEGEIEDVPVFVAKPSTNKPPKKRGRPRAPLANTETPRD